MMTMNNNKSKYNPNYTQEFKDNLVKRMLPPENISSKELSKETGVSQTSLTSWLKNASPSISSKSKSKFQIVIETYPMNEAELSAYARANGLFVKHIKQWQKACESANDNEYVSVPELKEEIANEKKLNKKLEKELRYKEKALAETAALLVLSKKLEAICMVKEED